MKELIKNILVYVVIVSVLKSLVTNQKYRQYFQFLSGLIMILLMLTPIISLLDGENTWYNVLEEQFLQMDLTEVEDQMKIADGKFAKAVEQEYQETVAAQVKTLAQQKGMAVEDAKVVLKKEKDAWMIQEISLTANKDTGAEREISVETVQMEKENEVKKEDTSGKARALRKQLCDYFVLGEDKVHIWK